MRQIPSCTALMSLQVRVFGTERKFRSRTTRGKNLLRQLVRPALPYHHADKLGLAPYFWAWLTAGWADRARWDGKAWRLSRMRGIPDIGMDDRVDEAANSQSFMNNGQFGSNLRNERRYVTQTQRRWALQIVFFSHSHSGFIDLWSSLNSGGSLCIYNA